MTTIVPTTAAERTPDWAGVAREVGRQFAPFVAELDRDGEISAEAFHLLRACGLTAALVPADRPARRAPPCGGGIRVEHTWDTLGLRATGSQTLGFDDVFVPDAAVALTRRRTDGTRRGMWPRASLCR